MAWPLLVIAYLPAQIVLAESTGSTSAPGWRVLGNEQGVRVSTRREPNAKHPTFRGEATIEGDVLHVLAVVLDTRRSNKWVRGADAADVIKDFDGASQHVYMFTDLPWPIRDRDMAMKRSVEVVKPGAEFLVRFACAPKLRTERPDVLRVTSCDSHFRLKRVSAAQTYVDYQVDIDPGGGLPQWSIRWMEKRITVDTLARLQRQVKRTTGQYQEVMQRWAAR
jgi:hypothetical protein